ncbi:MAG: hypothetical protein ABIT20_21825 [Gemmatimonadaceae bacterium]
MAEQPAPSPTIVTRWTAPSIELQMISIRRTTHASLAALALAAACGPSADHVAGDSALSAVNARHTLLAMQLGAQKDSLTRVVLQADDFIMHIDSSVSTVKGLPKNKRSDGKLDPLARQIENRKVVMARVDALVARARATAAELAKTNTQLAKANKVNVALREQIASDSSMITDLNVTIQRQIATIQTLSVRIDSLKNEQQVLATTLATVETVHNKAYYVIGREDDLVKRGVIVREGGANLLFAHPGRTLQVARTLDPQEFTPVDQRGAKEIAMPDSTRRYRVISRQSLDDAVVGERDRNSFKGNLKIADANRFWAPSRYLVLVEQ